MKKQINEEVVVLQKIAGITPVMREEYQEEGTGTIEPTLPVGMPKEGDQMDEAIVLPHIIEFIKQLHDMGYSPLQIAALQASLVLGSIGVVKTMFNLGSIVDDAKQAYQYYKTKGEINPEQIEGVYKDMMGKIETLSPGKKRFMISLLNKMKSADPNDTKLIFNIQQSLKSYADRYGVKEGEMEEGSTARYDKENERLKAALTRWIAFSMEQGDDRVDVLNSLTYIAKGIIETGEHYK